MERDKTEEKDRYIEIQETRMSKNATSNMQRESRHYDPSAKTTT